MDLSSITIADFKTRFYRDFTYASVPNAATPTIPDQNFVQDADITNAFTDAKAMLNQGLFGDDDTIRAAYLYLSAHCLCLIIRQSQEGIDSPGILPVQSRGVGSVNESYQIPDAYRDSPILAQYTQTSYGLKYLNMAQPAMVGNMAGVFGGTHP